MFAPPPSFFPPLQLQIIHDQGSYSFLVCGMIFGGLAFTFYAFLLFFHRMYPKPSAGKQAPALSPLYNERKSGICSNTEPGCSASAKCEEMFILLLLPVPSSCFDLPTKPWQPQLRVCFLFGWRSEGKRWEWSVAHGGTRCESAAVLQRSWQEEVLLAQTAQASLSCSLAKIQGTSGSAIQRQLSGS